MTMGSGLFLYGDGCRDYSWKNGEKVHYRQMEVRVDVDALMAYAFVLGLVCYIFYIPLYAGPHYIIHIGTLTGPIADPSP